MINIVYAQPPNPRRIISCATLVACASQGLKLISATDEDRSSPFDMEPTCDDDGSKAPSA